MDENQVYLNFQKCENAECNAFAALIHWMYRWDHINNPTGSTFALRISRTCKVSERRRAIFSYPYFRRATVDAIHFVLNIFFMWNVYLLKCNDSTYYTGCTSNLKERLLRHRRGEVMYTSTRLPIELVTYIVFSDKYKAFQFEKYLKSGSGKAFTFKRLV